jgi:hypothetical protein
MRGEWSYDRHLVQDDRSKLLFPGAIEEAAQPLALAPSRRRPGGPGPRAGRGAGFSGPEDGMELSRRRSPDAFRLFNVLHKTANGFDVQHKRCDDGTPLALTLGVSLDWIAIIKTDP